MISGTCGHNFGLSPNKLSGHFQSLAKSYPEAIKMKLDRGKRLHTFEVNFAKLLGANHE